MGPEEPTVIDLARAAVLATGGVASHHLAGVLLGLDSVGLEGTWVTVAPGGNGRRPHSSRRRLDQARIITIAGLACTDGMQTLADLGGCLSDDVWEQALESALRKGLTSVEALSHVGNRQVLARRPVGAPATDSLLETLMVQLVRAVPGLTEPVRQLVVEDDHGRFVARVDLCWPELGLFVELDGQHHAGQPVYGARRETAVVAATGWLCGRFTWTEVTRLPMSTGRRLTALADRARRRPQLPRSSSATR